MYWLEVVLVFLFGLCWGSFLALMVYRIPREISIIKPRSFCDSCKYQIPMYYNIPLLSYIILKARCKNCSSRISIKYPIIELTTAVLITISFTSTWLFVDYYSLLRSFILITAVIPSIFIDIDHRIIPDRFSLGLVAAGFILALIDPGMSWLDSVFGIVFGGGILLIVAWAYYKFTGREGLGGGDIKLLAGLGALMGWYPVVMVMFISSVVGALYGLVMMLVFKKGRHTEIAFGPFIGIAAILYYFLIERGVWGC